MSKTSLKFNVVHSCPPTTVREANSDTAFHGHSHGPKIVGNAKFPRLETKPDDGKGRPSNASHTLEPNA